MADMFTNNGSNYNSRINPGPNADEAYEEDRRKRQKIIEDYIMNCNFEWIVFCSAER